MANTFPGSGNIGIGTTTPPNLLTIDTGSGNSMLAMARICGKSPAWVFGSPNTGYSGGEAFIGSVTFPGDYVEKIVLIDTADAMECLPQLTPVKYNLKARPDRQLMGFVMEDVPAPFAVDGRGVNVTAVVATLAAVVRAQREALDRLQARVDALEAGGPTP